MDKHLKIAKFLVRLFENRFKIFNFRFGLDPIFGLIPGGGDTIGAALSLYLIWIAIKTKLPKERIWEMLKNIFLDFILGLIPLVGDTLDFLFKSNELNWKILEDHLGKVVEGEIIQ
jgi:hypothetical protein